MTGFILGIKTKQSQIYNEDGVLMPVTSVFTAPCYVVDFKWLEKEGYTSIVLGTKLGKHTPKPVQGTLKKAGIKDSLQFLREIRFVLDGKNIKKIEDSEKIGIQIGEQIFYKGSEIKPEMVFKIGDKINVSALSKGKGFQGVVRRHGFAGGPKTHGQSDRERAPGSIGNSATPGRVFKGKRMPGRMGGTRATIENLEVISFDETTMTIKGLIPGFKGGLVEVRTSGL